MTTADAAARSCIQPEAGTLCTVEIRIGIKDVARELVFETDPRTRMDATVVRVRSTRASDLTDEDAHAEQCETPAELVELLRTHYPDLRTDETVWVHEFELEENR